MTTPTPEPTTPAADTHPAPRLRDAVAAFDNRYNTLRNHALELLTDIDHEFAVLRGHVTEHFRDLGVDPIADATAQPPATPAPAPSNTETPTA